MLRTLSVICLALAPAVSAGPVEKLPGKNAATVDPVHPMYFGSMNSGLKVNDAYTEGNFSIVAPVWSTLGVDSTLSGGMLFLEPYISWGEQGEVASSIGLGYRYLFGSQPFTALTKHDGHQAAFLEEGVIVGANVFVDMLDTETNHQFWQIGVGAEVLTRYVELRGNYYIPITDKKEVGSFRTEETFQSTSYQSSTTGSDPYATGNAIYQNYSQITTQTTTTTTIERLFRQYEEGMEGWDLEVGLLIPWVDRYMDAKAIFGYYAFDNQPFGPQAGGAGNVEGWKAGLELRPVPALVLNGTWYEDERLTGSDWTLGVRLEVPFEAGELGDGKNLWSRMGDAFRPRRRHLVERMAEPVRRQNAAVKLAKSSEEDEKQQETSVKKVTKVVSQSQGQLVLADDVIFVNNGSAVGNGIQAGSPAGTGTAESPVDTIQAGAAIAGPNSTTTGRVWSVYTQGTTTNYTGDVGLNGNANFIGSGMAIVGLNGRSFGKGGAPVLDGGFVANALGVTTMGVTAYVINGGNSLGDGITAEDLTSLRVIGNTFNNMTGDGVDLLINGTTNSSVIISQNTFRDTQSDSVELDTDASAIMKVLLSGNTFIGGDGDNVDVDTNTSSKLFLTATGNTFVNAEESSFDIESHLDSSVSLAAYGNTFHGGNWESFLVDSLDTSDLTAVISGNVFRDGFDSAVDFRSNDDSTMSLTASGNYITGSGEDGIAFDSRHTSDFTARIIGNVITDSFLGGVLVEVNDDSVMNLTASGNTITRVDAAGIDVSSIFSTNAELNATITGNNVSFTGGPGIAVGNLGSDSTMNATIAGNTVSGVLHFGVFMQTSGDTENEVTIRNNAITSTALGGIAYLADTTSESTLSITSNNVRFTSWEGIWVSAIDSTSVTLDITGNVTNSTGFEGIHVDSEGTSDVALVVNNNSISFAGDDGTGGPLFAGLALHSFGTASLTSTSVSGNTIRFSANQGVEIKAEDTSVLDIAGFNRNTITGSLGDGLDLNAFAGTTFDVNGTLSNSIGPSGTLRLNSTVDAAGTILVNGAPIPLPGTVP